MRDEPAPQTPADEGGPIDAARRQEGEWIRRIASGGARADAALRLLNDAYDAKILGFCVSWHFGLTRAEAEDVLQETWVRVWRYADDFREGANASPWIWKIVRHLATDVTRDRYRKNRKPNDDDDDEAGAQIADPREAGAPQVQAADVCVQRALQHFARQFPVEAEVIRLRDLEGWAIKDVADYLGRTETATRTFLCSVRPKLQPYLAPCLELLSS
jgi:RNA polymerase sigma-70 factor (ECF subfamily)